MAISTSASKAKGRRLQQAVRDAIFAAYPDLEPNDVRSCAMGSNGEDVQLSPAAARVFPFSVEAKARAKVALIYDAIDQASRHNDRTPIAVIKADRKKPLVVIDLENFMKILKKAI